MHSSKNFKLIFKGRDWISLIPFVGTAVFIGYVTYQAFVPSKLSAHGKAPVNLAIDKDKSKVVNIVEIEDLDKEKISYCRCWRSEKVRLHFSSSVFCFFLNSIHF